MAAGMPVVKVKNFGGKMPPAVGRVTLIDKQTRRECSVEPVDAKEYLATGGYWTQKEFSEIIGKEAPPETDDSSGTEWGESSEMKKAKAKAAEDVITKILGEGASPDTGESSGTKDAPAATPKKK